MNGFRTADDIAAVKELLGISSDEFAKRMGVSRVTLSNWLSGKSGISEINTTAFYDFAFNAGIRLNKIKEQLYKEELSEKGHTALFHGSKNGIEGEIELTKSKKSNDFGVGFYCGESLEQSAMFVAGFPASSLYIFDFDTKGLKRRVFGVSNEWMLVIAYFRNRLGGFASSKIIRSLLDSIRDADYIVAPIADNRMFEIIDSFIDGEITDQQCQHSLSATNLGNQYVLVSEKALKHLSVLEKCFLAQPEKEFYLDSRKESVAVNLDKVRMARRQYRGKGKYIEELLK